MSLLALAVLALFVVLPGLVGQYAPYLLAAVIILNLVRPSTPATFLERKPSPLVPIFVAAFGIMAVTTLRAMRVPGEWTYTLNFLALLIALPVFWRLQRDARPHGMTIIASCAFVGALICLGVAVVEIGVLHMPRAGDIRFNPIQFGDLSVLLGFLALAGAYAPGQSPTKRMIYLLGPVAGTLAAYLSGTRGAVLAAPVLGLIALVLGMRGGSRNNRLLLFGGMGALVAAALGVIRFGDARYSRLSGLIEHALTTWHSSDISIQIRLDFWRAGIRAFADSPLWGHGWNHMVDAARPYMPAATQARSHGYGHLHNDLINFAVSAGVLGLVAYVAILAAPIAAVLHTPRDRQYTARLYAVLALVAGFAVFGLTNVTIGYGYTTALYAMLTVLILAVGRDPAPVGQGVPHAANPAPLTAQPGKT